MTKIDAAFVFPVMFWVAFVALGAVTLSGAILAETRKKLGVDREKTNIVREMALVQIPRGRELRTVVNVGSSGEHRSPNLWCGFTPHSKLI
jgi:hypothetical protein